MATITNASAPPASPEHWGFTGTRGEVESALVAARVELRPDEQVWCLDCSRRAREVQRPANSRGVRQRRR